MKRKSLIASLLLMCAIALGVNPIGAQIVGDIIDEIGYVSE